MGRARFSLPAYQSERHSPDLPKNQVALILARRENAGIEFGGDGIQRWG